MNTGGEGSSVKQATSHPHGDEHAAIKCPYCGKVGQLQAADLRDMMQEFGMALSYCGSCEHEYELLEKEGMIVGIKEHRDSRTFLIHHYHDRGDQGVTIMAPNGFDPKRAAIYLQFYAEEWFGHDAVVSNLGIAAALVTFYGCWQAARNEWGEEIDMHVHRDCSIWEELKADASLHREGLRGFLRVHLHE